MFVKNKLIIFSIISLVNFGLKAQQVTVLGEGAWGTAIASVLANNGYTVKLWCNDPGVVESITKESVNRRYLPGIVLPKNINPTISLEEALADVEWIFNVSPVKYLRSVLQKAQPFLKTDQRCVMLSKGIEQGTLMLPTQIIDDVFGMNVDKAVCVGPSFADEVAKKRFTAVVAASDKQEYTQQVKSMLENDYFKVFESSDMIGAQVGSALKNVIALGIGILDGAGYGENAQAIVLAKGLRDMITCAQALGGQRNTMLGLAGVGDLILTCKGGLSRNVMVGRYFGQGKSLEKVIEQEGVTPEGVNTAQSIYELAQKHSINLPVCAGVYDIVFKGKSVDQFLTDLTQGIPLEKVFKEKGAPSEMVDTIQLMYELAQEFNISFAVCEQMYDIVFKGTSGDQFLADLPK